MALGSPGGDTIVTTVLQVLIRTIDRGESLPDALAAPRIAQRNHSLLGFTLVEPEFTQTPEYDLLRTDRGHEFFTTGMVQGIGAVNAVAFLDDGRVRRCRNRSDAVAAAPWSSSLSPVEPTYRLPGPSTPNSAKKYVS